MTSYSGVEFASGDGVTSSGYTSGRVGGDVDEVIFVEGPREVDKDHVMTLDSSASDTVSTLTSRQLHVVETTTTDQLQPWIQPRTSPEHGLRDGTSSQPMTSTTATSSDVDPAEVKTNEAWSAPRYLALRSAVSMALEPENIDSVTGHYHSSRLCCQTAIQLR